MSCGARSADEQHGAPQQQRELQPLFGGDRVGRFLAALDVGSPRPRTQCGLDEVEFGSVHMQHAVADAAALHGQGSLLTSIAAMSSVLKSEALSQASS